MNKFGLKLWSNNKIYFNEAEKLYKSGIYQYLELYVVPGSYESYIKLWESIDAAYVIHASTYPIGLNLSNIENRDLNMQLTKEVIRFSDHLKAKTIIMHSGTNGTIEETVKQLKDIYDKRMLVENKPYLSLYKKGGKQMFCNGNSPEEIKYIMEKTGVKFCLDIGHGISSANSHKIDPIKYLNDFLKLKPSMFHFTDGDYKSELDSHDHFGSGNYPVKQIMEMLPKDCMITIESVKGNDSKLDDFTDDVKYLKEIK